MQNTAWGKFNETDGSHHLAHHCADVAACFLALSSLPIWRGRLEQAAGQKLSEQELQRLAVLVFLHDIGKLLPGFQAKVWPETDIAQFDHQQKRRCRNVVGHAQAGAELILSDNPDARMKAIMTALQIEAIADWANGETLCNLLLVSFAHHGRPLNPHDLRGDRAALWATFGAYDPLSQAKVIGDLMKEWFATAFAGNGGLDVLPGTAAFQHLFAGLIALADWIGSDRDFFPFAAAPDLNYFAKAQSRAEQAIKAIGIDTLSQRQQYKAAASFERLTGYKAPNSHQAAIGEIPPETPLVILEAETGSGKTEAALWHYIKLYEAGRVDGLYFAVPTRTAAVQLRKRIHDAAKRVFEDEPPQTVLAIPGYYVAGDHQGRPLPHWRVLWDDGEHQTNETIAKLWAAEHSKRYLAAQLAVGTIDQAMLGALPVKHAHLRASSLARSLLVIDEVHASDIYMTRIQQKLVADHIALGGHVLAMSATLGSSIRAKWLGQPPPEFETAKQTGYPAIWLKGRVEPIQPVQSRQQQDKMIAMNTMASMAAEQVADKAIEAARRGAKILVIRNTVDEAVKCFAAVADALGEDERHLLFQVNDIATLHHGRFAAEDRKLLDARVKELFGKKDARPAHGLILIGTQTLEQSLDICADYMITDLCPVDVLLQRLGRLHRHKNERPTGFAAPRCLVLLPDEGLEKCLSEMINGLGSFKKEGCLSGIYIDIAGLELTRRLINEQPAWRIPAMNRELVESATHPTRLEAVCAELGASWQAYRQQLDSTLMAEDLFASMQAMDRSKDFIDFTFPGGEDQIRTRLGEDGFQIKLDRRDKGPFGQDITRIVIPAHWSRGIKHDAEVAWHLLQDGSIEITVSKIVFIYNALGLIKPD